MDLMTFQSRRRVNRRRSVPSSRWVRMLSLLACLALLLAPASVARSEDEPDDLPDTTTFKKEPHESRPGVPQPFKPGESLRFSVQYGFIHAGSAWLEVPEIVDGARPSSSVPGESREVHKNYGGNT